MPAAESPAAEASDCTPLPAAAAAPAMEDALARVTSGTCWRGAYQVGEPFGEPEGRWFKARQNASGENVWLRVSSAATSADRDRIWPLLGASDSPHLQKPLECHTASERVEVWRSPDAPSLRQWRSEQKTVEVTTIRRLVQHLLTALELLHGQGLGHFGLRPDSIYVRSTPEGPEFCLGGMDAAEPFAQRELIPVTVNVLYAPPEAAGLYKHSPGPLLTSWDWWSLGRVVQEVILGHHALLLAPPELTTSPPRSRLQLAEAMLFERDVGSLRAGAVELMPAPDAETSLLLRGLLTSAREGRWGAGEVREWLAGHKPKERYNQPRQQRFFRIKGRGCTPPEAAQILIGPEHCQESVAHVFGLEEPGRLAHFLHETQSKHNFHDLLQQAAKLTQASALKGVPAEMTREIAAAIALMAISGGEFHWRGRPVAVALVELLEKSPDINATCALLRAFGQPVVLDLIKHYDSTAAGRLESLVAGATEGEMLLNRCCISRDKPAEDLRRLWLHALEPTAKLAAIADQLHRACARTTNATLEKIFTTPNPGRGLLVLLAWTSANPPRYGFLTHAEVKAQKLAELRSRARAVSQILFWLRLERALSAGPLLFGSRWPILGGALAVVLLLAVHVPGPSGLALGLVPFALLAALRLGLNRWQAGLVRTWTEVPAWQWHDGILRCRTEARALAQRHGFPTKLAETDALLKHINAEITTLSQPDPALITPWPPRHWSAWLAVGFSWAIFAGLAAGSLWRGVRHPPSWTAHHAAWDGIMHPKPVEKVVAPQDQKQTWPYRLQLNSPFPPMEITTADTFEPTGAQLKAALTRARELLDPYNPDTVDTMVAIFVPLEDGRNGLLFYEGKKHTLLTGKGVVVEFMPGPKEWMKLGEQYMVYLGK